jgi:hypothetical protein
MMRAYLVAAALAALVIGVPLAGGAPTTPTITSSTPASPANNNTPTLNGTADPGAAINLYTDNACMAQVAGPVNADGSGAFQIQVTVPVADDTSTMYYATATDATGTSPCPANGFQYVEDSLPPGPPTITGPPDPTASATAHFDFNAEPGASFLCQLDGAATFSPCPNPYEVTVTDGPHTLVAKAVDAAQNVGEPSPPYVWTVDTTAPPPPTITEGPANPSSSSNATFVFTDADSTASFRCRLDGGGFSPCTSPQSYSGLSDGSHTFRVRAVDLVGKQSSVTRYDWSIDTVHPLVTLSDKPPLVTNRTTASFSFSSDRPGSTFQCRLDGGGFVGCSSPKLYNGLGDGSHTFAVRATSVAGPGIATTYTWRIDTVPPQTAIASTPPARSNSASANFTFASSEPASTFACSLDSSGFSLCASPKSYLGLGNGPHTFRVQAVDAAGNTDGSPATYTWQIANVGPATVDHVPPRNVARLRRIVGYGRLQLRWKRPADHDFDHVGVYVSTSPKSQPRTLVYRGKRQSYTNRRFKNGLYYRYLVVSYDQAQNASRGRSTRVPASVLLESPRNGSVVRSPPVFRWNVVRRAAFYNVQLYYGNQKVLSAWPRKPRQRLTRRWTYAGRRYSLRKGAYTWFVWPAFGPRRKSHYGQLLGQGTFKVR